MSFNFDHKNRNRQTLATLISAAYIAWAPTGTLKSEVSQHVPPAIQLSSQTLQAEATFRPDYVWHTAGKAQIAAFATDPRNLPRPAF